MSTLRPFDSTRALLLCLIRSLKKMVKWIRPENGTILTMYLCKASFALSPMYDFMFVLSNHGSLATEDEATRLKEMCEAGAWNIAKRFDLSCLSSDAEGCLEKNQGKKRPRMRTPVFGNTTATGYGLSIQARLRKLVEQLRASPKLTEAFRDYYDDMDRDDDKDMKQRRIVRVTAWLTLAGKIPPILANVLRVALAKPLTSVKCETNFQWLQHLLSDKRLGMGPETL